MDGPGFHVDVDEIEKAAQAITETVGDQKTFQLRGLCGDPELYGDGAVHDALMRFCVAWSEGLDTLICDAGETVGALTRAARAYRDTDDVAVRALTTDPAQAAVAGD